VGPSLYIYVKTTPPESSESKKEEATTASETTEQPAYTGLYFTFLIPYYCLDILDGSTGTIPFAAYEKMLDKFIAERAELRKEYNALANEKENIAVDYQKTKDMLVRASSYKT
jgi:hypothetical protein